MLSISEALKVLQSYNINSQKYGPTIYKNNDNIGICLEIKDNTFGFLTRAFTFENANDLENFLKMYFLYKKNQKKYNIELSLNEYNSKTPIINYTYNNELLTLDKMLNFEENIKNKNNKITQDNTKEVYIKNIEGLTKYLIDIKELKDKIKTEKNNLKKTENDLKFELLEYLAIYYAKEKKIEKKPVSLDIVTQNYNINTYKENLININEKSIEELEEYLKNLINIIKEEELDEKNLVNIYSNSVYKYNIEILNKQIEFVKNKIEAEKNFNLKGSKIHNIDEELKSFLKTNIAPVKINVYLEENKNKIQEKYNKLVDINNAYSIISGNNIDLPKTKIIENKPKNDTLKEISQQFDELTHETKALLILYNSFYKNICNYILNNNYPSKEKIKENFDIIKLYNEIENIVFNEFNSHYLNTYFKYLNFKNIDDYIESIINICKTVENTNFTLTNSIKTFYIEDLNKYKSLTITPILSNKENIYIIDIPSKNNILYIPDKIEIDEETKEFNIITTKNIYLKNNISINNNKTITLHKYNKVQVQDIKHNITITTDLDLKTSITFKLGFIEGEINE